MSANLRRLPYQLIATLLLLSLSLVPVANVRSALSLNVSSPTWADSPEVLVLRVYFRDHAERDRLAVELGAAEVATLGGFLTVYTDWATYDNLRKRGLRVEIDREQTEQANPDTPIPNPFYGGYRTMEEIEAFLDQHVATNPTLAEKIDIGDSWCKTHLGQCTQPNTWNGFDLWVLRITNRDIPGPKPIFWFDAGIHPLEIATPELATRFISWLLDGYNTNPDARWLVDHHEVWVLPVLNPDGHHMVESGGNNPYPQRKNADWDDGCPSFGQFGTDLNRNFPFLWGCCSGSSGNPCDQTYRGPSPGSEEETQAVVSKIQQLIPDQRGPNNNDPAPITTTGIYQSMHTAAQLNLYAWGWTGQPSPNNADISNIGAHMSAFNADGNGYPSCQPPNCLYGVDGATLDWSYGELGIPGFTTELDGGLSPQYSCLDNPGCGSSRGLWPENKGVLIYQAKIARTPYLLTRGPDANVVTTTPMTVTQGTDPTLTATINYNWNGNAYVQNVAAAEYYIDTPPWAGGTPFPMDPTDGSYNSLTEGVVATVSTGSLTVGRHILFVRGRGVNNYQGYQSWGPISAAFLHILPGGTPTPSTNTPVPPTATATNTALPPTNTPDGQPTATPQATAIPTSCPIQFTDVPPGATFYSFIRCMACRGIINGYTTGCEEGNPCFRPNNNVTRGQLSKIVSNAAGFDDDPGAQQFEDVPVGSTFFNFIGRLANRGIIAGYPCGGPGEPCVLPDNLPYFRPNANVTRGQLSKIVSEAAGYTDTPGPQQFEDILPGSTFYDWIWRLADRGIMSGYPCGGPGETCVLPDNRPYFRPGNNATRGQASKIVANTFFPGCVTP
ncbi:MAG: M14 family zinc carboxypeptidase [Chloroflexia bacterium]